MRTRRVCKPLAPKNVHCLPWPRSMLEKGRYIHHVLCPFGDTLAWLLSQSMTVFVCVFISPWKRGWVGGESYECKCIQHGMWVGLHSTINFRNMEDRVISLLPTNTCLVIAERPAGTGICTIKLGGREAKGGEKTDSKAFILTQPIQAIQEEHTHTVHVVRHFIFK